MKTLFAWLYSVPTAIILVVVAGIILVIDRPWSPKVSFYTTLLGSVLLVVRGFHLLIEGFREKPASESLSKGLRGE